MSSDRLEALEGFLEQNRFATKKQVREFLYDREPDISKGGIRGWLNRQFAKGEEPWNKSHKCPKCGKVANNTTEIQELFGLRLGGRYTQSRCKGCR